MYEVVINTENMMERDYVYLAMCVSPLDLDLGLVQNRVDKTPYISKSNVMGRGVTSMSYIEMVGAVRKRDMYYL